MELEKIINIVISLTVFGLALSIWCIGVFLWLGRYLAKLKIVRERLGISADLEEGNEALRLWRDLQIQHDSERLDQEQKPSLQDKMNTWLQDTGWEISLTRLVLLVAALLATSFVIGYGISQNVWVGICSVFATFFIFMQYTQSLITKRANLFERQLVDALGVAARALRAGHPLVGAFQLIAEEIGDPLGKIFSQIYQQQAFGSDLKESITAAAKATRNTEFKLFATAVSVQLNSGGNLADLMDSLASVVRARIRLNKRIRVLTAQTQFSKMILIAMPFVMFILLNIINRDYMDPLYSTTKGNFILIYVFFSIFLGYWMMSKMIKIKY